MKKLILVLIAAAAAGANAQNLDTTTVTDQLNLGVRGNTTGNPTAATGAAAVVYAGADATGSPSYINAYAGVTTGDTANGESPVVTINGATWTHPDYNNTRTGPLPANTRPGATDGTKALIIGDDGGQNTLLVGNNNSANYYIKVDVLQLDNSANLATQRQVALVGFRSGRDGTPTGGAYLIDRDGAYGFIIDYQKLNIRAVEFNTGVSTADENLEVPTAFTVLSTTPAPGNAWYTVEIGGVGPNIYWKVNGTQVATLNDSTFTFGRGGLGFRANGANAPLVQPTNTQELSAIFDNLVMGPTVAVPAAAGDWQMFE